MKILALDTATDSCSVALTDGERLLAETSLVSDRTHSRHLAGMIRTTCRLAQVAPGDIDAFAVTRGPGSFTGLRIGLSTVKGLAEAADRPVCGVSTLRVLAEQAAAATELVCPLIDARREEVYCSTYRVRNGGLAEKDPEQALRPEHVVPLIGSVCTFVGNGAVLYGTLIRSGLRERFVLARAAAHVIRASTVARLASRRFESGTADDIAALVPTYLRKSDARMGPRERHQ
jgi:tRNA threonylcarbamoyladenosine biosynthesis protein TsaB